MATMDDLFISDDEDDIGPAMPQGSTESVHVKNSEVPSDLRKNDTECEEGELKRKCHICGKLVEHIDKHMMANHEEKVECQLCNQTFSMGNLRWHILNEHCHNKVTKCSLCEEKFATRNALKNHVKVVHAIETSICSICQKKFKDLYSHVKYFHKQIRNHNCTYCEKKFQAKKLLYSHIQSIHLGEKTYCPQCKKYFSVDNFSRHVKEFHEKIRKLCPYCKKEYGMSNLSKHIRCVHNKICDICNAHVSYSISLHKRQVHNIGKPIQNIQHIQNQGECQNPLVAEEDNESKTLYVGEKNFTFSFV